MCMVALSPPPLRSKILSFSLSSVFTQLLLALFFHFFLGRPNSTQHTFLLAEKSSSYKKKKEEEEETEEEVKEEEETEEK